MEQPCRVPLKMRSRTASEVRLVISLAISIPDTGPATAHDPHIDSLKALQISFFKLPRNAPFKVDRLIRNSRFGCSFSICTSALSSTITINVVAL